jgi:translation initiation factor 3 subunit B
MLVNEIDNETLSRYSYSFVNMQDWTEMRVAWSPLGTYLATFHARGIAVWAGPRFTQLARFPHQRLETLDFSPRERFLVTYSNMDDSPENPHGVIVWETKTGTCCRVFYRDPTIEGLMLKWNFDDSIIAKLGNDCIYLYETRTFSLLEQKGQRVERVRELSWSPTESTLAFWTEERPDVPSRVVIQSIELTPPSASAPGVPQFVRKELRSSNLFEVADVAFHWHRSGDYLCVRVSRYAKKAVKKDAATGAESIKYLGQYVNLEIFHIREKGCPVDKLEIKEELHFLAWEPIGTRFAFISGQLGRTCVQLYAVEPVVTKLRVFDKSSVNQLYWSPSGQYLVLASVHQQNASGGSLDFVDAEHQTIVNSGDHPGLSICEWDPTGRFFVSCVSLSSQKIDNGLMFWSCMGRTLFKHSVDHLTQFVWRPRPPSPLTESALKEIKKNMKKYSPHFELQDRLLESELSKELLERREHQMSDFRDWYARLRHELNHPREKQQRLQLRDKEADDRERAASREMVEEKFEFLVSVNRENQSGDP